MVAAPDADRRAPLTRNGDIHAVLLLGLLATAVVVVTTRFDGAPLEDAAMLMRYSEHLAAGYGLVWNVGEQPVDGATDFLFTVVVATVTWLGVSVEPAARLVSLLAWLATVAVVYRTARDTARAMPRRAFVAAAAVVVGTATLYVSAGFGTPFFGLWVALLMRAALRIRIGYTSARPGLGFGLAWLGLGLTRPEGVLLGAFVLGALWVTGGLHRRIDVLVRAVVVMTVLGGLFFDWRWSYFGYPLPNPFYKKGGSTLHADGLLISLRWLVVFAAPFVPVWLTALRDRATRRDAVFGLVPIFAFSSIWILLSAEMNYAGRFQYAVHVMIAMTWPMLLPNRSMDRMLERASGTAPRIFVRNVAVGLFAVALVWPSAYYLDRSLRTADAIDERAAVGETLAGFAGRGHLVATTEAGLIPLRSGWRALDLWGLNDQTIAHRGQLTFEDLDRAAPTVVFTHAPQAPDAAPVPDPVLGTRWTDMTVTVAAWAQARGYLLVRSAGHPGSSTWNIWVRPGTPDSAALGNALSCAYPALPRLREDRPAPQC